MPKFQLYIESITCEGITDSHLEGDQDELYLQVWNFQDGYNFIRKKINLGNFVPGKTLLLEEFIFEEDYHDVDILNFDFYDSDFFSSDDLLGGFILGVPNIMKLGHFTSCIDIPDNGLTVFSFSGNGGKYLVAAKFCCI